MAEPIRSYDELRATLAEALKAAAGAQEAGLLHLIGARYGEFDGMVPRDADPRHAKLLVAITFWDFWIDSSNHDWLYYPGLTAGSWPPLARSVAADLSADRDITSEQVLRLSNQRQGSLGDSNQLFEPSSSGDAAEQGDEADKA